MPIYRLSARLRSGGSLKRKMTSLFQTDGTLPSAFGPTLLRLHRDKARYLSVEPTTQGSEWSEPVRLLLMENSPRLAHDILEKAEQTLTISDVQERRDLDSWITHQDTLLESYDVANPDRTVLKQICESAEQAHTLLGRIIPSLSAKTNVAVASQFGKGGSSDSKEELSSTAARRHYHSFDASATARCDAVLTAWARAARAGHMMQSRPTRAIPQRAQYLLEQMEASFVSQSVTETTVRPSVESYNRVLETWVYSHENLRGSMAERIFLKLSTGNVSGSCPSGESYKLIIKAWVLSGERRAAFTATGHLMKMLRKLEKGVEDMEPSLDEYRSILKTWTNAEYVVASTTNDLDRCIIVSFFRCCAFLTKG
jgi:hypothetical protein